MKQAKLMKNIEIVANGIRMTMKTEDKLRLSQIWCAHPYARITTKENGKTYFLDHNGKGLCWQEAK